MASEQEIERLIVRLVGEGDSYQRMLREAQEATDSLEREMKRLGGTEKDYEQITSKAAAVTQQVTKAVGAYNWEQRRLQGLLDAGRISQDSYNRQLDKSQQNLRGTAGALQQFNTLISQSTAITRSTENAAEAYRRRLAELNSLLKQGFISQETFNRAVRTAQKDLVAAGGGAAGFAKSVKDVGSSIRGFGVSWSLYVTAPITAFLTASAAAGVRMDSLKRGLTAVTGSAAATEAQLADLREVARLPGLGFAEAIEGSIRLQATGFSANLAKRALMAFGNALATVGKGKADLDGVILALTQISSKGKVMAQEINQLGERVPQIRKIMEKAFGTANTEELQKMGLSSQQFIEGIIGELEKLPKVTGGARNDLENFSDAAFVAFAKVGNAVLTLLAPALARATELVEKLGNWFAALHPSIQSMILVVMGLIAVVGPLAVGIGLTTIAFGALTSAIAASTTAALAFQVATGAILVTALAAVIYELTGMREVAGQFNEEIERSSSLSSQFAAILQGVRSEILQTADALEGVDAKAFAEQQLTAVGKNIDGLQRELREAENVRERLGEWTNQPLFHWLVGETAAADQNIKEIKDKLKAASDFAQELRNRIAAADTATPKSELDTIKEQAALRKETDQYIKSLKSKIETLERGEAATKRASLAERGAGIEGFDKKLNEIDTLVKKHDELNKAKAAKKEAADVQKDLDTLTHKLEAQIAAFGDSKKSAEIYELAQRGANRAGIDRAQALADQLQTMKDAQKAEADLANDVKTLTDNLKAQVAVLEHSALAAKDGTENLYTAKDAEDLFALAARGASEAVLAEARALAQRKKELEDNKKLMEEGKKLMDKYDPKGKFLETFKQLNKMLDAQAITRGVYNKALQDAKNELVEMQEKANIEVSITIQKNDLVRAGTAEFYELIKAGEEFNRKFKLQAGANELAAQAKEELRIQKAQDAVGEPAAIENDVKKAQEELAAAKKLITEIPQASQALQNMFSGINSSAFGNQGGAIPSWVKDAFAGGAAEIQGAVQGALPDGTVSGDAGKIYDVNMGVPKPYDVQVDSGFKPQEHYTQPVPTTSEESEKLLTGILQASQEMVAKPVVILSPVGLGSS